MLIPYRVDVPLYRRPIANYVILAALVICYGLEQAQVPDHFENILPYVLIGWNPLGLIGHIFLHGGLFHLIGNMIFLWVFGNAVCEKVGNIAYPFLFLGLGVFAGIVHLLFNGGPAIGASGAINGIVGMFLVWFPTNDISMFYLLFIKPGTFEVSSYWMILLWLVFDILGAAVGAGAVAYWAHLGGFAAGAGLALLLTKLDWVSIYDSERTLLDIFGFRKSWAARAAAYEQTQQASAGRATGGFGFTPPGQPAPAWPPATPRSSPPPVAVAAPRPPPSAPPRPSPVAEPAPLQPAPAIKVHCRCGKLLKAKAEAAGKICRCPACGHLNRVPES